MIFLNLQIRGPLALIFCPLPSPVEMIRKENHFGPPDTLRPVPACVFSLSFFSSIAVHQALDVTSLTSAGINSTTS